MLLTLTKGAHSSPEAIGLTDPSLITNQRETSVTGVSGSGARDRATLEYISILGSSQIRALKGYGESNIIYVILSKMIQGIWGLSDKIW